MRWNRKRIYAWFFVIAAIYLVIHYLIFDKDLQFTTFTMFLAEGREHIWHVAPIIVAFFVLLIIDRRNRKKEK